MRIAHALVRSGLSVFVAGACLGAPGAQVQDGEAPATRTLAPYFFVAGADPQIDRLPLEESRAEIAIAGTIPKVVVHQVFKNDGGKPIEAVYVFPASTRAAVHAMHTCIGVRTIEARIAKRAEARADYEATKLEGKRASLLQQERPNVFTTSVANIMPGDRIEVVLEYSELLVPENAVYEFVYPTVVGPRYVSAKPPGPPEVWTETPYLPAGAPAPYRFALAAEVRAGVAIKELTSPSHKLDLRWTDPQTANVTLAPRRAAAIETSCSRPTSSTWRCSPVARRCGAWLAHGPRQLRTWRRRLPWWTGNGVAVAPSFWPASDRPTPSPSRATAPPARSS